jgi:hypothetical protein
VNGELAGPRDIPPTNPDDYLKNDQEGRFFYGRVAGVAQGSQWEATLTDPSSGDRLTIPQPGGAVSYVVSTVDHNTFGTEQIQSAPMLARYTDTAYRAHGNYGVHYKVKLPLFNDTDAVQQVTLRMQTPLQDETLGYGLRFLRNPADRIFFRGTVRIRYQTESGRTQTQYVHVVQRQGDEGEPMLRLDLPPQAKRDITIEFIYPPDATPPQVLTIATSEGTAARRDPRSPAPDAVFDSLERDSNPSIDEATEPATEASDDTSVIPATRNTSASMEDESLEPRETDAATSSHTMDEASQ